MAQSTALPVIGLSRFHAPDADRDAFLVELRSVAHEMGFFYVTGHGVPAALREEVLSAARRLFALPEEQRLEIENLNSPSSGAIRAELAGGLEAGRRFVEGVRLFSHLANIGDVRSLVIHPASTTHAQLAPNQQLPAGVTPGLVRLSVGTEGVGDLIADRETGLRAAAV